MLAHVILLVFMIPRTPPPIGEGLSAGVEVSLLGPSDVARAKFVTPPPHPPMSPSPVVETLLKPHPIIAATDDVIPIAVKLIQPPTDFVLDQFPPTLSPALPLTGVQTSGGGGKACGILAAVQSVVQSDLAVRAAIDRIPQQQRSVANAIMLWDRNWLGADGPIQAAIRQTVAAAAPICRDEAVIGPRLLIVPGPGGVTVLALGSGAWRWSELLTERVVQ